MASGFYWTVDTLTVPLNLLPAAIGKGVGAVMMREQSIAEGEMRANAPWQDQTGNARTGLSAQYQKGGIGEHYLHLFHRVDYGIWLEIKNSGQYAAVRPQLEISGRHIMEQLSGLLVKLGGLA